METTIPLTADIIVKLIGLVLGLCLVLYWAASSTMKKSKNDWDAFYKLKKKANDALTLKEIEEVHKELQEFGKKVYNQYIHAELHQVDGYLRGMYKILKQQESDKIKYKIKSTTKGFPELEIALHQAKDTVGWKDLTAFVSLWCKNNQPNDSVYDLKYWVCRK